MPRKFEVAKGIPLLNIASFARGGPQGAQLTPAQVEHIERTIRRVPEVMVKVLPRGSNDFKAAGKHLDYISRKGKVELETDDGQRLAGRIGKSLLEDWDLDIDESRPQAQLSSAAATRPKLIHKLIFSMPPGTPSAKVLGAVRNFAREEFAAKHRYAFVLHTDEPHPHVHLLIKAVAENGIRLNIKKANLQMWRSQFAHHLRQIGVPANATERTIRGAKTRTFDHGQDCARRRGQPRFSGRFSADRHSQAMLPGDTRSEVSRSAFKAAWEHTSQLAARTGQPGLVEQIRSFVEAVLNETEQRSAADHRSSKRLSEVRKGVPATIDRISKGHQR